nr:hypothetical protein [Tanacetum cinerariifolium]
IASRSWSFAFAVPSQMTYLFASLAPNSSRSYVMEGASCTQRRVSMSFTWPSVPVGMVSICHGSYLCFQSCGNTISNQLPNGGLSHDG